MDLLNVQFYSPFVSYLEFMAAFFLLSVLPLGLVIGAAADTMRAAEVETLLQRAADASVIAGAPVTLPSDDGPDVLVKNYLSDFGALDGLKTISKIERGATKDGHVFVRVQGEVDTRFLDLLGISRMNVMAYSEMRKRGN